MADYRKPLPQATPETEEFWAGLKRNELRIQRCNEAPCAGKAYFPPRPFCPGCGSRNVSWFTASGKARLHTYVINQRPAPGFEAEAPYAIAVVELDEGPRFMTNITGIEQTPEALRIDMPLELAPDPVTEDVTLPKFRPAGGAA